MNKDEIDRYSIGYQALQGHAVMNASSDEKSKWFNEFIKFKESSNLYSTTTGRISLTKKNGKQAYYILTQWPYQAPPGDYTVTVYAVRIAR